MARSAEAKRNARRVLDEVLLIESFLHLISLRSRQLPLEAMRNTRRVLGEALTITPLYGVTRFSVIILIYQFLKINRWRAHRMQRNELISHNYHQKCYSFDFTITLVELSDKTGFYHQGAPARYGRVCTSGGNYGLSWYIIWHQRYFIDKRGHHGWLSRAVYA